jgi:hypothetical protein
MVLVVVVGTWGVGMSEHIFNMGAELLTLSLLPACRHRHLMVGGGGGGAGMSSPVVVVVVHWDAIIIII